MPEKKKKVAPEDKPGGPRRGGPFWQGLSFEELAELQGIRAEDQLEWIMNSAAAAGFTAEDFEGFDEALARWRGHDLMPRDGE